MITKRRLIAVLAVVMRRGGDGSAALVPLPAAGLTGCLPQTVN